MIYGSVCSGISSESVAWRPLGWSPAWFSEIGDFPNAVLQYRYPQIPNLGDLTRIYEKKIFREQKIDILVGGTPCTSFSQAGRRQGLADPRGNLALEFLHVAEAKKPRWIVWENVPGVLSSSGGRDFAAFVGRMGDLGYGYSWQVLDACDFGVPQSRRRLFVVGHLGDWQRAAAVFSDGESMLAAPATSRSTAARRRETCPDLAGEKAYAVQGHDIYRNRANAIREELMYALTFSDRHAVIAIRGNTLGRRPETEKLGIGCREGQMFCLTGVARHAVVAEGAARYLTPRECERLMGFPDDYTKVPFNGMAAERCPDNPCCEAIGNSMAVPVMRWIGERIAFVDSLSEERVASFLALEDFAKTLSDPELIQKCVQSFRQLRELVPYLREARDRFTQPGRRVPVPGNPTWTEWVEQNLHISMRRVQQLLRQALEPSEIISLGRPKGSGRLVTGDWRGLLEATERRLEQVFGALQDEEELSEAVRKYAQGIADRFAERHGRLTVSVKSRA